MWRGIDFKALLLFLKFIYLFLREREQEHSSRASGRWSGLRGSESGSPGGGGEQGEPGREGRAGGPLQSPYGTLPFPGVRWEAIEGSEEVNVTPG